jgi:hypothetical protein
MIDDNFKTQIDPKLLPLLEIMQELQSARHFVIAYTTADDKLITRSRGIRSGYVAAALRDFAESIEQSTNPETKPDAAIREVFVKKIAQELFNSLPAHQRGHCPACGDEAMLSREISKEQLLNPATRFVCTCGAFLSATLDDAGALQMRVLTLEEVGELPDSIRIALVHMRERLADIGKRGRDED